MLALLARRRAACDGELWNRRGRDLALTSCLAWHRRHLGLKLLILGLERSECL